ncbi:hypothetical protein HUU53_01995 [Candidatus Micrarchaeota archaeon]|nr:hypothetical protein [Candidatus Micrarchaeota archaeon]
MRLKGQLLLLESMYALLLVVIAVSISFQYSENYSNAYAKLLALDFAEAGFKDPEMHDAIIQFDESFLQEKTNEFAEETNYCFKISARGREVKTNCDKTTLLYASKKAFYDKEFFQVVFSVGFND